MESEKIIKKKSSCKFGLMKLPFYIPYSDFVPGKSIQVTVELDSSKNMDVDYIIRIRAERIWKIIANTSSKSKKSDIVKKIMVLNCVEKHTSITLMLQIQIPKCPMIVNFKYCGVITDTFTLRVEVFKI
uniref:Arrestin C-terminal-like domain-containing protein n=1 Tax=Schizaphis graminum TaxID=13262 RepID=A0A2S2PHH1_SCHGA